MKKRLSTWVPRLLILGLMALLIGVTGCSKEEEADPTAGVNLPEDKPIPGEEEEGEAEFEMDTGDTSAKPAEPKNLARDAARNPRNVNSKNDGKAAGKNDKTQSQRPTPKRVTVDKNILNVESMFEKNDIREATGYTGLLERDEISGQGPTRTYNSSRWRAEKSAQFGFGLEVWKPGNSTAAVKRFEDFYAQSMGGEKTRDVGDESFRTSHHDLNSLIFLDRRRSAVATVSCDVALCDFDQLAELARRVQRNL